MQGTTNLMLPNLLLMLQILKLKLAVLSIFFRNQRLKNFLMVTVCFFFLWPQTYQKLVQYY